jgi:uncharacterized protein YjbI with pentapeptide repeats
MAVPLVPMPLVQPRNGSAAACVSRWLLDLRGADLRNCDLTGLPKSQILLEGADVRDAQLPS